jgi:hypothetical protein
MGTVDVRPVLNAEEKQIFLTFPGASIAATVYGAAFAGERQKRIDQSAASFSGVTGS